MKNLSLKYVFISLGFVSLFLSVFCFINLEIERHFSIVFLPLFFSIFIFCFCNILVKKGYSLAFWMIMAQMVLRYVFFPLFVSLGSEFKAGFYSTNFDFAVALMVWEMFWVFFAFSVFKVDGAFAPSSISFLTRKSIVLLLLIIGFGYIISKSIFLLKINFIWDMGDYFLDYTVREEAKDADNLDHLLFFRLRVLALLFLIGVIWQTNYFKNFTKWAITFTIVLLNASIIVGSSRFSIVFITIPFLLLILSLYPQYKKLVFILSIFSFCLIILATSLVKFSTYDTEASTDDILNANTLNAYFTGVGNISLGIDAYENTYLFNRAQYLITDFFQNIPGFAGLVDQDYRTTKIFNYEYYGHSWSKDQIVPIQVSAFFHVGYLFSFIYGFGFTILAFYFERLAKISTYIVSKYVWLYLCLSCSLFMMLNFGSLINNIVSQPLLTLLPLMLIDKGVSIFNYAKIFRWGRY